METVEASLSSTVPEPKMTLFAIFKRATLCGWNVAKQNLLPASVLQVLMFLLVMGYYLKWPTSVVLDTLGKWREQGGPVFGFVATGLAAGVLAEIVKVYTLQRGRWQRENVRDAIFKFLIIGFGGLTTNVFYALQDRLFGSVLNWQTIVLKVFIDQFIFNPVIAAPIPCFIQYWCDHGFSRRTVAECFTLPFYIERVLPLLVTTWFFWMPMVSLIYALPALLQFPLFLCAVTIWGLLFTSLLARKQTAA